MRAISKARVCRRSRRRPLPLASIVENGFFFIRAHFLSGISSLWGARIFFSLFLRTYLFIPRLSVFFFFSLLSRARLSSPRGHREVHARHRRHVERSARIIIILYITLRARRILLIITRARGRQNGFGVFPRRETCEQYPKNVVSSPRRHTCFTGTQYGELRGRRRRRSLFNLCQAPRAKDLWAF